MRSIFYRQCKLNNSYFLQSQYRLQLSWVQKAFFSSSSFANTRAANPDPYVSSPSLLPNIISSSLSSPPSFIMQTSADATGVTIIDGKATADTIREELKVRVDRLSTSAGRAPGLAVVLVGSRPDSATYVRMKKKACAEAGIVD